MSPLSLRRHRRSALGGVAAIGAVTLALTGAGSVGQTALPAIFGGVHPTAGNPGDESHELMDALAQWNDARTAPSPTGVAPGAYTSAYNHFKDMPADGTSFTELTNQQPYDSDNDNYSDRVWSNSKGGSATVTGRITALAVGSDGTLYAGGANGGVFRSADGGASWTPIADHLPALGAGGLVTAPDGSLWLGTGEGNTNSDAYVGSGVYRIGNGATDTFSADNRVGGDELESHTVRQLRVAGAFIYAATSRGLYRHAWDATSDPSVLTAPWELVLAPCSGVGTAPIACGDGVHFTQYNNIANDIAINPKTGELVASMGWRGGSGGSTAYNGFYYSNDGTHWTEANPTGAINPQDIGNATLAYSQDGTKLYTVIESVKALLSGKSSVLAGIYVSPTGDPNGPWNLAASVGTLATSGSALKTPYTGHGYQPGVQAWYNQFVGVDPTNANHVYVGLEEVYESWDAGQHWTTVGRYWNFGLKCFSFTPSADTCDGNVMHSDQHAIAFGNNRVYVGNDGGIYSRLTSAKVGWDDLSASGTVDTLQYYGADVGPVPGGTAVWGGLQDNGQSLLIQSGTDATTGKYGHEMVSPVGGDGGIQLVNKANGCQSLGEYVTLELLYTVECGKTAVDGTPQRVYDISPHDPDARFIAPFSQAVNDSGYWVAGGSLVYADTNTWPDPAGATPPDSSDWKVQFDNGNVSAGVFHPTTAITSMKLADGSHVIYDGWCSGSCAPDGFKRGFATNFGGTWHNFQPADLNAAGVPNSFISDVYVDQSDPTGGTVYMTLSGYSRKWQQGPGAGYGHVWKSTNGGATWTNLDGLTSTGDYASAASFPDVPANQIRIAPNGDLLVSTDLGLVVHKAGTADGTWERVGPSTDLTAAGSLPNVPVVSVAWGAGDGLAYVATHGRGIWTIPDSDL